MARCVAYWLFDNTCTDPRLHGYVGITVDWPRRLWRHKGESDFSTTEYEGRVLFEGTIKQCLQFEQSMRSTAGIGWNKYPGGRAGYAGKGIPKSPEHREKIRLAALARYSKPGEKERTAKAVKRGLQNIDRTGANNPNFGKHQSEETKQKVRDRIVERGGVNGENNPNYRHGNYVEED